MTFYNFGPNRLLFDLHLKQKDKLEQLGMVNAMLRPVLFCIPVEAIILLTIIWLSYEMCALGRMK